MKFLAKDLFGDDFNESDGEVKGITAQHLSELIIMIQTS